MNTPGLRQQSENSHQVQMSLAISQINEDSSRSGYRSPFAGKVAEQTKFPSRYSPTNTASVTPVWWVKHIGCTCINKLNKSDAKSRPPETGGL